MAEAAADVKRRLPQAGKHSAAAGQADHGEGGVGQGQEVESFLAHSTAAAQVDAGQAQPHHSAQHLAIKYETFCYERSISSFFHTKFFLFVLFVSS